MCAKKKKEYGLFFFPIIVILFGLDRIREEEKKKKRRKNFFCFSLSLLDSYFFNFWEERTRKKDLYRCVITLQWNAFLNQSINRRRRRGRRRRRRWVELLLAYDRSFSFTSNFFPIIYLLFLFFLVRFFARASFNVSQRLTVNTIR